MPLNKDDIKILKKTRGRVILPETAYVDGYEDIVNSLESVYLYTCGIFIEGVLSIKGYIPVESIMRIEFVDNSADSYQINMETNLRNAEKVVLRFPHKPKNGLTYFIKLMEIINQPLSKEEIESYNIKLKRNKKMQSDEQTNAWLEAYKKNKPESKKEKLERYKKEDIVYCPKCLSTQITAHKRGFSVGQALTFGMLAGMVGSNKIEITCLSCGHKFKPGQK